MGHRLQAMIHYMSYVGIMALLWLFMVSTALVKSPPLDLALKVLLLIVAIVFGVSGLREISRT